MSIFKHPLTYIALIFLVPFFAAAIVYKGGGFGLAKTKHYGELIPPVPSQLIKQIEPELKQNAFFEKGKWHLVLVLDQWSHPAVKQIDDLVRVKVATGKDQDRVSLRVVLKNKPFVDDKDIQEIAFYGKGLSNYQDQVVYLVDPQGLEMMQYAAGWKREGIYKDLRRLLNVSKMS